jgi:putative DNA primase/helicase
MSNTEDDPEQVVVPRLRSLDADPARVQLVQFQHTPSFPKDFEKLAAWIKGVGAKIVFLDPIAAHFTPERYVHDRGVLRELVQIAQVCECAIVGVHHFTKTGTVGGPNGGLVGTARAVYRYGFDPRDEDQRVMSCVKINVTPLGATHPAGLVFAFEPVIFPEKRGRKVVLGRMRVIGRANVQARRAPGHRDKEQEAEAHAFLSELLALAPDCELPLVKVVECGAGQGFSWGALNRAATVLGIEHENSTWRLPDEHPLRKQLEEAADESV